MQENHFHFKFPCLKSDQGWLLARTCLRKRVKGLCELVHPFHGSNICQTESKWEHVGSSGIMKDIVITRRLSVTLLYLKEVTLRK